MADGWAGQTIRITNRVTRVAKERSPNERNLISVCLDYIKQGDSRSTPATDALNHGDFTVVATDGLAKE